MAIRYLRVRKFSELQHYKDRPDNPWIRLYVKLLDDEEFKQLAVPVRLLWVDLLLLAQRSANVMRNDPEAFAKLFRMTPAQCREAVPRLLKLRWLSETRTPRRASNKPASALARAEQSRTERSKGRTVVKGPARSRTKTPAASLPIDITHELDRLMPQLRGVDSNSRKVIETEAAGMSLALVAKVRESVERNGGRVGVGYVVNALRSEKGLS